MNQSCLLRRLSAHALVREGQEPLERIAQLRSPDAVYGDMLKQTRNVCDLKILRDLLDKTDSQLFEDLLAALK